VPLLRDLMVHIANEPRCEGLKLEPLAPEEPIFGHLVAALRAAGLVIHPFFSFYNWYLVVAGRSADEILEALPPRLANTIHRKSRSLDASARARVRLFTRPDDVETAIADCERVYRRGWQSEGRYQGFAPGLMRACANHGWLRLGVLYVDEVPAAAQFWIVVGRYALIFSLAYDEQYAKLSLGTILMAHMLRHAVDEDRVEVVDFLQGNDAYKRDWMSHRRERWGIIAMNPRKVRGILGIARHRGGWMAKRLLLFPLRAVLHLARRLRP
jgi:CelD/BcsL family acetyltransferase involved in cellulose biosynthesis